MVLGCAENGPEAPLRPDYVSKDAEWVGGWDGGRWHHCTLQANGLIECTQWQYASGYTTQSFRLCGSRNPSKWASFIRGDAEHRLAPQASAFELVPVGPMTVYNDDKISKEKTKQAQVSFAEGLTGQKQGKIDISCPVHLTPEM